MAKLHLGYQENGVTKNALMEAKHAPPPIPAEVLEAWKTKPKEQCLKEAIELYRAQGIDITEARFKLDVLKFIAEIQGAQAPVSAQANIISIIVSTPEIPEKKKVIDVTAEVKSS